MTLPLEIPRAKETVGSARPQTQPTWNFVYPLIKGNFKKIISSELVFSVQSCTKNDKTVFENLKSSKN